ncbi:nitrous oxide reductase accessory protein NosL [Bacillus sp. Bva_UNVM-123]|uniref:nitrous oxide reductase accessory protein NosL n=1 Tax=Bacillus sp. Bva_UNVM-123 TaxID=2829798 RepID=UPI00391FBC1A
MKKLSLLFFCALFVLALSACGSNSTNEKVVNEKEQTDGANETANIEPIEPTKDDVCAFCSMKVYTKEEEMGVFTAQAIDSKGKHLFFDDSGCLLNYERETGEAFKKMWVRDYITKEWINAKEAVPVYGDIHTPMKYGFAFFETKDSAQTFISENSNMNLAISTWDEIDKTSNERYKKMDGEHGDAHHDHDHEHGDDHDEEHGGDSH